MTADQASLFCREAGVKTGKGTVLLIHGALGSGADWDLNIPYLENEYHLLLPDLPGHGKSQHIQPYSPELSARLLANIIAERAQNGKAHIIGLSLGMSVALDLISGYPDVVNDVFVSGYKRLPPSKYMGHAFWLSERIESYVPRPMIRWLMDGTDLPANSPTPCTLSLCKDIMRPHAPQPSCAEYWPFPWPARTLIVSAGKSGIVPSADDPEAAVRLRDIGREMNAKTVAYTHPLMRHPWHRQDPKLFAETAKLWFEQGRVPEGFVEL